jgi:hypothetical protein
VKADVVLQDSRGAAPTGHPGPVRRDPADAGASCTDVKTWYLYSMSSRLVNVRLDEERVRKAKALREKGISLSDVIRTAIDERYERALSTRGPRDVRAILERLDAEYPITAKDLPSLKYDVHDRRQVAAVIRRGLDRRRGRRSSR